MKRWPQQNPGAASSEAMHPAYAPAEEEAAALSPVQLQRMLRFLKRYWWVPTLTLVVSVGMAVGYVVWVPATYVSRASMWETEKLRLPDGAAFTGDLQNYLGTQMELLRSDKIRQLAIARLQAANTNGSSWEKEGKPPKLNLSLAQAPKSTVILIEGASPNPAYAQGFLNALMSELLEYKKNIRKLVSGDALASISDQVLRLERELKADQEALTAFERTNNLAILQEEGAVAGGYLTRLKTQMSDVKLEAQLLAATDVEREAAGVGRRPEDNAPYLGAFKELELLKLQRDRLSRYLRPKHPKMIKLESDIEKGEKLMALYQNQTREQLAAASKAAKMKIETLQASVKEWEGKVVEANARIAEAERLKLSVSRSQGLYDRLVMLLQNVDISRNIDQETLAILQSASTAERSYKAALIAFIAATIAGLGAGVALVFLIERRDDRFTAITEVTQEFGERIVGQVPEVEAEKEDEAAPLLEADDKRHMYAEAYRNLRSGLLFLPSEGAHPKILLVTSALPGEGKSTIAANLARTLALGGSRVLLVDGDLRRGRLHQMLKMEGGPGLAELLRGSSDAERVLQQNCWPNLSFISRGNVSGNPGDLFLSRRLEEVLSVWRKQFDYVLIDSCPAFAADDATTLAPKVDGTLFVVRSRYARAAAVHQSLELLYQRRARVLGLIYNRADISRHSYDYYNLEEYHTRALSA